MDRFILKGETNQIELEEKNTPAEATSNQVKESGEQLKEVVVAVSGSPKEDDEEDPPSSESSDTEEEHSASGSPTSSNDSV